MRTASYVRGKQKYLITAVEVHYLVLDSEPKEVTLASRGSYGYHGRYLAKRRLMRHIRRLRLG